MKTTVDQSFVTLANVISDGVMVYLDEGFVYANAQIVRVLGYDDVQELCGTAVEQLFESDIAMLLQADVCDKKFEVTLKTKLAQPIVVEIALAHIQWLGRPAKSFIVLLPSKNRTLNQQFEVQPQIINRIPVFSRDGIHKTVRGIGERILDDHGKEGELIGAVPDIANLARSAESNIRLKKILEATPDFIAMCDIGGHVVYMNKGGRRMVGVGENADLSDKQIADFHSLESMQLIQSEGLPRAMRDGMWRGETDFLTADGKLIPAEQIVVCHKTVSGQAEYFSTIARDISVNKRIEVIL